ncbi:SAM-dependent methyltransferase [Actinomadura viridis]|uniref:SAM-dependent methyltransferase n=1 Tax=Actinomadura viridis TaxID=58110 RepID=UPI003686F432
MTTGDDTAVRPAAADIGRSYEDMAGLTETIGGPDLHYGYWDGPRDPAAVPAATRRLTDLVVERLRAAPGDLVLDAGCGNGLAAVRIAETTGARVVAVDVNPAALERGVRHAREHGVEDLVEFRRADALALPYGDGTFDAALAFEITPHFELLPLLGELTRVLRTGGRLVLESPCLLEPAADPEAAARVRAYLDMFAAGHMHTARAHLEAFHDAGLRLLEYLDLSEHTAPFFPRMLHRLERHRADLVDRYGSAAVERERRTIAGWARVPGSGSVLLAGAAPDAERPPDARE